MQYLFLLLMLTGCGQKTDNAKPEAAAENITNIALAKYEAREELTEEEYLSLRKPVPDWETYKRLVRVEDGFDNQAYYLETNKQYLRIKWIQIVYYDPKEENYYQGIFNPANIVGLDSLVQSKKDPVKEVYGRDRMVLITNISPNLHVYADAFDEYQLYVLELKSTIDEYGAWYKGLDENNNGSFLYYPTLQGTSEILYKNKDTNRYPVRWRAFTNRTLFRTVQYFPATNGVPVQYPIKIPYLEMDVILAELSNTNKLPVKTPFVGGADIPYTEETKEMYYLFKYNFYGDISELTNRNPPMKTELRYQNPDKEDEGYEEDPDIPTAFTRSKIGAFEVYTP